MATKVEQILRSFEELPDADKHRLAVEILRWSADAPQPELTDEELVRAADAVFQGIDRDEEGRG